MPIFLQQLTPLDQGNIFLKLNGAMLNRFYEGYLN